MTSADAQALTQSAIAALRRGDAAAARALFEQLAAARQADATVHLGLAFACTALQDSAAAISAVDAALAIEPRNLQALMLKADHLDAVGDVAAASFYQSVVTAAPPAQQLVPELQQLVARAKVMCDRYTEQFGAALRRQLVPQDGSPGQVSPRFAQSLDILLGEKTVYFQEPRLYYFPELPQIQFYDRARFPWLDAVEAATADIREELLGLLDDASAFAPYVQFDASRPTLSRGGMLNNANWSACYLWKNGAIVPENAQRCPRTLAALAGVPTVQLPGRSPSVLFSLLKPGARIPPHNGILNTRLICHLPLIVPPQCGFRVGNDTREWVEGKAWLFDDTIEHEAWNLSDQTRVILLFEVWRPELTEEERRLVTEMFITIDRHRGGIGEWSI